MYKRQGEHPGLPLFIQQDGCLLLPLPDQLNGLLAREAVSYTHLDVYKRQSHGVVLEQEGPDGKCNGRQAGHIEQQPRGG